MKCNWPLKNGQNLQFDVFGNNDNWNSVGGLYIFSYQLNNGNWRALYVGKTNDFSSRLPSHERLSEAVRLGATHIHVRVETEESTRQVFEQALIESLQPVMNVQYA